MNNVDALLLNTARNALIGTVIFWFIAGVVVTYLVNRRRETAAWAKASLFLAILGMGTIFPWLLALPAGHLALRQIRRSAGALKGKVQAIFGLFCGYGVVALGIGMTLFGVSFLSGEHKRIVMEHANVQAIENAKKAWAAANNKKTEDAPTASELAPFMPDGQFPPASVAGETYKINALNVRAIWISPPAEY